MQLINNYILIKPDDYSAPVLPGGLMIYQDTSYEVEKHSPQSGVVIKHPEKLDYQVKGIAEIDFDTLMELIDNDYVIFDYTAVKAAQEHGMMFGGLAAIKYTDIYMVCRDKEIFAVNGRVVVEPMNEHSGYNIIIPPSADRKSLTIGKVHYSAKPLGGYKLLPEYGADNEITSPGDMVLFHPVDAIPLQYDTHQRVMHGNTLYRMQHLDICAKIVDGKVIPINNYVVIRQDEMKSTGIYATINDFKKPQSGTVIRVGAGYKDRPLQVPVGAWCSFEEFFATTFEEDGVEYKIVQDINIPYYILQS